MIGEPTVDHCLQGGAAKHPTYLHIEGFNVVLKRDDDHDKCIDFDSGKTIVTLKDRATARLLLPN